MNSPASVLILRPGALGDAVLTLPVLRKLKNAGAQHITVLGSTASWAFLSPDLSGVKILDWNSPGWLGLFSEGLGFPDEIQSLLEQTDLALVYLKPDRNGVETALRKAGVKQVIGSTPPLQDETGTTHASERLLEPLHSLDKSATTISDSWPLRVPGSNEINSALERVGLPQNPTPKLFVFHPGSGGRKKCWPAERFARVALRVEKELGLTPLIIAGEADEEYLKRINAEVARLNSERALKAPLARAHQQPLADVMALIAAGAVYLGNDSGITHLAGQLAPKVIALFGPTDPNVWSPLGKKVTVLRAHEHTLAPLEELSEERVFEAIRRALL